VIPLLERISFDKVTDVVYLGSRIAGMDDYHRLRAHGVKACVDMKAEGADPWTFESFLWLPTVDHEPSSQLHLKMGISFLRQCELARASVFVHCMAGVGRSAAMVLAYLLAGPMQDRPSDEVVRFLRTRRPVVNPSPAQVRAAEQAARDFTG
jgi:hypothetical protein